MGAALFGLTTAVLYIDRKSAAEDMLRGPCWIT
jgi:hypothetical protein